MDGLFYRLSVCDLFNNVHWRCYGSCTTCRIYCSPMAYIPTSLAPIGYQTNTSVVPLFKFVSSHIVITDSIFLCVGVLCDVECFAMYLNSIQLNTGMVKWLILSVEVDRAIVLFEFNLIDTLFIFCHVHF